MNPRVALLVVGDGRDELRRRMMESFFANAKRVEVTIVVEVDDREHALGFCGAIQEGWRRLRMIGDDPAWDYVAHLEEDFEFLKPFSVAAMARLLDTQPHLCQVALRRGPVNDYERQAGEDITMLWPDAYTERFGTTDAHPYLEHRLNWTTNPSLYRRALVERFDWPDAPRCEEAFSTTMIAEGYSFAYWGGRGEPWLEHHGHVRTGHGY